ncbi:MAG: UPF0175 family protein [Bacteroidota bacterium]
MKTITVHLPEDFELSEFDVKMILAGQLYQQGKLSSWQAAGLAGISKREFLESIGGLRHFYL